MYGIINNKRVEGNSLSILKHNAKRFGHGVLKVYSETAEKLRIRRVRGSDSWARKVRKTTKADKAFVVSNPVIATFKV